MIALLRRRKLNMHLIDQSNKNFSDRLANYLEARGVEFSFLESLDDEDSVEPNCIFWGLVSTNYDFLSDKKLINFLKKKRIRKACLLSCGSEYLAVQEFFNKAVTEVKLPIDLESASDQLDYYFQYFLELGLKNTANLPGYSDESRKLVNIIKKIAPTSATVLVNGPTGSGKELISSLIHQFSDRKESAFIAVNCAAIPDQMLESILFGHEKGSFTGAVQPNQGLIRAANFGTILLDEISEMPLNLQSKLLRVIQEKKVMPLGSSEELDVNVRIIATTNRNMIDEVKSGNFREDLFYRLNVFPLKSYSLKERSEDIVPIAASILAKEFFSDGLIIDISPEAIDLLKKYDWPGNVRELDNLMQRAKVLRTDQTITKHDLIFDTDAITEQPNTADVLAAKFKGTMESERI